MVPGPWCVQWQPDEDISPQMVRLISKFCHELSKDTQYSVPQPGQRGTPRDNRRGGEEHALLGGERCANCVQLCSLWVGGCQRDVAWEIGGKRVSQLLWGKAAFPPPAESSAHCQTTWLQTGQSPGSVGRRHFWELQQKLSVWLAKVARRDSGWWAPCQGLGLFLQEGFSSSRKSCTSPCCSVGS